MVWFILTIAALVILFVVLISFATYYYYQSKQCQTNPSINCWGDWTCPYSQPCPAGVTNDPTCWSGTKSIYDAITDICKTPQADGTPPPGCSCGWQNTMSSSVCIPDS